MGSLGELFKLVGSIYIDNNDANKSLAKTDEKAGGLGKTLGKVVTSAGKMALGVGTAAAGAGAALLGMANSASESLDAIQKGAQKMNMTYDTYQKLGYVCDMNGMSIDSLSKGMKNITNNLADLANGNKKAASTYEKLGVSLYETDGTMRDSETVLMQTIYALADMEDVTQRNAIAQDIFGNAYTEMLPMLNSGGDAIEELMFKCEDLGLVMSDEAVDAGAAFGDSLADVKKSLGSVATQVGASLMPTIQKVLEWVTAHMPQIQRTVQTTVNVITSVLSVVGPILLKIMTTAGNVISFIIPKVILVANLIASTFSNVRSSVKSAINGIIGIVNGFIRGLNQLKIPDWIPVVGGKGVHISTIPYLAKGGNITGTGEAVVGEAGPEIINLPKGATVTPLNGNSGNVSEKLDKVVDLMTSLLNKANTGTSIVLDTGELVGALAEGVDDALGARSQRRARYV